MGIREMARRASAKATGFLTRAKGNGGLGSPAPRGERPHVVIIIENLPLRLDRRVRHEAQALVRAGYAVSVICPKEEPEEVDVHDLDGVRVYSYPVLESTGGLLSYVWEFATCLVRATCLTLRIHRVRPFDVLQACNPPDTYWPLAVYWKLRGRPFVFDQHDLCPEVYEARFGPNKLIGSALLWHERQTYRVADRVISPNPGYREIACGRGGVLPQHSAVVMSTPDPHLMRRGPEHPELRHSFDHLVCYVGIMGPQDGVDNFIAAINVFVHELGRHDTHFALLGFGDSADSIRAECTSRGLDRWVTFTGRVDHEEISRWLSTADLGVTPDPPNEFNDRSTMNKTLEYMAHEVPVLAVDLRETRRCAQDAAVYVSGTSRLEAARAMSDLLDDPVRRHRMGQRGRARIEGELAWQIQAKEYVGVFDALTDTHRPAPT